MFKKKILVSTAIVSLAAFGMFTPNLASAQVLSETINSKTGDVISRDVANVTIISRTIDSASGGIISETITANGFTTTRSKGATSGSVIVRKIDANTGSVISETVETSGVISTAVDSKTGAVVGHSVKGSPVIVRTVDSATGEVLSETVMKGGVTTSRTLSNARDSVIVRKINSQTGAVISETVEDSPIIGRSVTLRSGQIIAETVEPDEVVSTGTRLQVDPAQIAAQTFRISFDDLVATGQPTLERAIRQLPQNSLGSSEIGGALSQSTGSGFNFSGISTVNLRGIGNDSTLILVNGKRIGRQGALGIGSDISMIPLEAVERVEVVMDGASSIYGADAVGGVVNIILKKDREDLTASFSVGLPENGGFTEYQADIGGGYGWGTGSASVSLSRYHTDALEVGDRGLVIDNGTFAGGLTSIQFPFVSGPNLLVPVGFSGNPADLIVGDPETGNRRLTLIPETTRYSARIDLTQSLSDSVEASLGYTYSTSDLTSPINSDGVVFSAAGFGAFLPPTNPFNTLGGNVGVRGFQLLGTPTFSETDSTTHNITLGLAGDIGDTGWDWEISGGYNQSKLHSTQFNAISNQTVFSLLRGFDHDSDPTTPVIFYDPFTGTTNDLNDLFLSDTNVDSKTTNKFAEAIVRGSVDIGLPAGSIKTVVGVAYNEDKLQTVSDRFLGDQSITGTANAVDSSGEQASKSAFGEILVPLIGANNRVPFFHQLDVSGSVRYDDYNTTAGESTTGSVGVVWAPDSILKLRANFASSFVAPTISQAFIPTQHLVRAGGAFEFVPDSRPPVFTGIRRDLYFIVGGNSELRPETADSISLGVELRPTDNLFISVTHHETDYNDRIIRYNAAEFTNFINHTGLQDLGRVNLPEFIGTPDPSTTNLFNPNQFITSVDGYVQDQRFKNAGRTQIKGVDFFARYEHETDMGTFNLSFNDSYTYKFEVTSESGKITSQVAEGALGVEILPENAFSANIGWENNGLNLDLNVSSRSSTTFTGVAFNRTVNPPTNVNLNIGYDLGNSELFGTSGILNGTRINFSVTNLTDKEVVVTQTDNTTDITTVAPQLFPSLTEARGRMYTFKVTKTF